MNDIKNAQDARYAAALARVQIEKDHYETKRLHMLELAREAKERQFAKASAKRLKTSYDPANDGKPISTSKRQKREKFGPNPIFDNFNKGDLVQVTLLFVKRQRKSQLRKDRGSVGTYYGPATYDGMAYVDWHAEEPWPHKLRQAIHVKYLEHFGAPR